MRKIFLSLILTFITLFIFAQEVKIDSVAFIIEHDDIILYLDCDTNSFITVHKLEKNDLYYLTGKRYNKWYKEYPYGPYKLKYYVKTGYDLGHLTPSHITSYSDSVNIYSFSLFNQAPQLASFNRGKWSKLEKKVENDLKLINENATIITGVIYNNNNKMYLNGSRIKIPLMYYKIVVTKTTVNCYIGSNINGDLITTDLKTILEIARKNKNSLDIIIK